MIGAISYAILATIVTSGGIFLIRELRGRADAGEDVVDNFADDPRPASLLTSVPSFHDGGR